MDLVTFGVQLLNAVQYGMVLFLVASGLTLVFGILGVINLAHGAFYMLGAYLAYWIATYTGSFALAMAGGVAIAFVVGLLLETVFIRRLYGRDHLAQVLLSFGLILSIDEAREILFGKDVQNFYLPIISQKTFTIPDLVITDLTATGNSISVTVKNQGNTPVSDAFWVDVYFNPTQTPALNKRWSDIAPAGAVWGVTIDIPAGDSLTLTVGDSYFDASKSSTSFPVGAQVYGYVDSVNYLTGYGAVQESNESNNLFGPVTSTAASGAPSVASQSDTRVLVGLPQR